jgi:hypothetical protein
MQEPALIPVTETELAARAVAPRVSEASIKDKIRGASYWNPPGTTMTVCVLHLWNGFLVVGESASASPANFDEAIGQRLAFDNAFKKIWQLEGYRLRTELHIAEHSQAADLHA